jgi:phenylacetate-CoA ligase
MRFSINGCFRAALARHFINRLASPPAPADGRKREQAVVRAFRHAADRQPVYRDLLAARHIEPASIRTALDFKSRVPVIGKDELFGGDGLSDFLSEGFGETLSTLYTSSGFTQRFAFAALSRQDLARTGFFLEEIFFRLYGIAERDVLVINCLSLGTEIPVTRFPQAKTGLRSDIVVEVLRRSMSRFKAVVLVGEPLLLKRVAEEGTEAALDWERLKLFVFTGSEYVSEYWRVYMQSLLRQDPARPEQGGIFITYGLIECGLAVCFETAALAALRRKLIAERKSGAAVPGSCPPFMYYLPGLYHLETVPTSPGAAELVVTALDRRRLIPLVRYRTGDEAELYSTAEMAGLLTHHGLDRAAPMIRGLPGAALWGRPLSITLPGGRRFSANEVKDVLFQDHAVARKVTGNFRLEQNADGAGARLLVQLAPGYTPEPETAARLKQGLTGYGVDDLPFDLFAFREFPFGFDHGYERKNRYVEVG